MYTLRVLRGKAKDSFFSGPQNHGPLLLLCCTTGADATAQLHVQMPNQESAQAQTIKRQSCQILFFTIKRAENSLTVLCGSKTSSYVRQTTALTVAIASGGPRRPGFADEK